MEASAACAFAAASSARRAISSGDGKDIKTKVRETPLKQTDAVASLELAKRALQDQLAKAEEELQKPDPVLANLRELQKQVQELIKKEEKLKDETAVMEK